MSHELYLLNVLCLCFSWVLSAVLGEFLVVLCAQICCLSGAIWNLRSPISNEFQFTTELCSVHLCFYSASCCVHDAFVRELCFNIATALSSQHKLGYYYNQKFNEAIMGIFCLLHGVGYHSKLLFI